MNLEYEIVVFSDDWHGLPFSCKHLLRHFLPEVPVIWVETIGLRMPKLNLYDFRRAVNKVSGWLSSDKVQTDALPKNLHIVDPVQIPYNQVGIIRIFNRNSIIRKLAKFQAVGGRRKRVIITTWPFLGNIIGCLNESLSIYYRVDDFSEFPGVNKSAIRKLEDELISTVDIVIATAENLTKVKKKAEHVKYLPHGVDYEHFSGRNSNVGIDASMIKSIPSPRIGFFGLLNSWVDFELLSRVARSRRDWSFIIIGPSQLSQSDLPNLSNMHFLGPVKYEELPLYAKFFDCAIIPFKVNELTQSVNPLKLMEYFSLGLPVVSTPINEVVKFRKDVSIASGHKGFEGAIEAALKNDNPEAQNSRRLIAMENSWKKKALTLKGWIDEALDEKIGMVHPAAR